ncbi:MULTISPECIES: HAD family hydrolase [Rhizobium/Agrobacterium group]|jgi:2-haloacid dehalogenase|uniref:HAD family hydrolase n=1 Tax=Rhizobium/Agrobacterium group TaxID=227290 RepID=UPI000713A40B|nr:MULTISPECIES: HAD family phosphatase [Rhizobium/Agrobacterium group]KQY48340.1 2-haloalkanoic acid dehalogenase [Rhizobium sp. Root483D2]
MSSVEIRHIVFDIGKVLIHYDPHLPFSRIIPDDAERKWFFANVCTHDWNIEQDRGRDWREAEDLLIAQYPDHADSIRAFRTYWHEMVPHAYVECVSIMESLIAKGYDVTMLTNFASDTFKEAQKRFPFLTLPRGVTVSGDIRLIKPDVAIYQTHADNFDLDPAATLFIDDSMPNVEGARAAGWQAVHFTDPQTLQSDLLAYGLSV